MIRARRTRDNPSAGQGKTSKETNVPSNSPGTTPTTPRRPRVVIATGADEGFAARLKGFVSSLAPFVRQADHAFACFDLGLSPETRSTVLPYLTHLVEPRWDLDVARHVREAEPHLRALTLRPWLRDYLPGYDVYVWIDSDVHVQHPGTIEWFIDGARTRGMTVVPQVHHAYAVSEASVQWRTRRMQYYFGTESAQRTLWAAYYNAGIFAIAADAPHWDAWRTCFEEGIEASGGELVCDQTALNEAIHRNALPISPLPAICNWLCHLAPPMRNTKTGRFVEPGPAGREIAMLHMSAGTKDWPSLAEFWR